MNRFPWVKIIALTSASALVSCESQAPQPPTQAVVSADNPLASQVFQGVNRYRRTRGASDLSRHAGLDRLAQAHCEYLKKNRGKFGLYGKNVSHFGSEGRALMARERFNMPISSENVASFQSTSTDKATGIVNLWINSKDHEGSMRDSWTHSGVGAVVDRDGMVFSTQIFATLSRSQMTTRQRFSGF